MLQDMSRKKKPKPNPGGSVPSVEVLETKGQAPLDKDPIGEIERALVAADAVDKQIRKKIDKEEREVRAVAVTSPVALRRCGC